jgi:hypothetical protein
MLGRGEERGRVVLLDDAGRHRSVDGLAGMRQRQLADATVLHLLGLDSRRLEVPGRQRLEMDFGRPITEILA